MNELFNAYQTGMNSVAEILNQADPMFSRDRLALGKPSWAHVAYFAGSDAPTIAKQITKLPPAISHMLVENDYLNFYFSAHFLTPLLREYLVKMPQYDLPTGLPEHSLFDSIPYAILRLQSAAKHGNAVFCPDDEDACTALWRLFSLVVWQDSPKLFSQTKQLAKQLVLLTSELPPYTRKERLQELHGIALAGCQSLNYIWHNYEK